MSGILRDMISDFSILSGICSDFLSGILYGILSDIYSDIQSSILISVVSVRAHACPTASGARDRLRVRAQLHQELAIGFQVSMRAQPSCIQSSG